MTGLATEEARALALAEVRAYCGWVISPSATETFNVQGAQGVILLPTLNLTGLASLTVGGVAYDVADVTWTRAGVIRYSHWSGYHCPPWDYAAVVEATHGYVTLPIDVQAVVARMAERAMTSPGVLVQVGQVRTAVGPDGLPIGGVLTSVDQRILDRYRLPPRP